MYSRYYLAEDIVYAIYENHDSMSNPIPSVIGDDDIGGFKIGPSINAAYTHSLILPRPTCIIDFHNILYTYRYILFSNVWVSTFSCWVLDLKNLINRRIGVTLSRRYIVINLFVRFDLLVTGHCGRSTSFRKNSENPCEESVKRPDHLSPLIYHCQGENYLTVRRRQLSLASKVSGLNFVKFVRPLQTKWWTSLTSLV